MTIVAARANTIRPAGVVREVIESWGKKEALMGAREYVSYPRQVNGNVRP